MSWESEYPTVADVSMASMDTIIAWEENLPAPQTDVEHTVKRRINKRLLDLMRREGGPDGPELADKIEEFDAKLKEVFGKGFFDFGKE